MNRPLGEARRLLAAAPPQQELRLRFAAAIRDGLTHPPGTPSPVKALDTGLSIPRAQPSGTAIAIDTGGTRLRACVVELGSTPRCFPTPLLEEHLPTGRAESVTADDFYAAHVRLVRRLAKETGSHTHLPIGWVFSYPARTLPGGDAELLAWTKELNIPGMVGSPVSAGLRAALARADLDPGLVTVLNDTVAVLLAGVARLDAGHERHVGLVVGTGTNMAIALARRDVPKLRGSGPDDEVTCINLESGNFDPGFLSEWDEQVDRESANPGQQRFEKAVAGAYLDKLVDRILGQSSFAGADARAVRLALMERSAKLVATGLLAACDVLGEGARVGVVCNGSLFWGAPGYAEAVAAAVRRRADLLRVEHDTMIGAALATLTPRYSPTQ